MLSETGAVTAGCCDNAMVDSLRKGKGPAKLPKARLPATKARTKANQANSKFLRGTRPHKTERVPPERVADLRQVQVLYEVKQDRTQFVHGIPATHTA